MISKYKIVRALAKAHLRQADQRKPQDTQGFAVIDSGQSFLVESWHPTCSQMAIDSLKVEAALAAAGISFTRFADMQIIVSKGDK